MAWSPWLRAHAIVRDTRRIDVCLLTLLLLGQNADCNRFSRKSRHIEWGLHLPVKVLTVTTNASFVSTGFKYFIESLEKANGENTPLELVIAEVGHEEFWEFGWRSKVLNILPALRDLPPEQIVILSDSSDVIWLPCGRDLRTAFLKFGADVVVGSSGFQWPDRYKEPLFPDLPIMDPDLPFRSVWDKAEFDHKFINAGIVIGRAGALAHYLGGAFWRYGWVESKNFDDQSFWANMYLAQLYDSSGLSRHPTIAIDAGGLIASQSYHDYSRVNDTGYWQSLRYRYTACIVHAPGGSVNQEPLHERWREEWSQPALVKTT